MKKKILSSIFTFALLVTAGFGVNKSMQNHVDLSLLALGNVEALAETESDLWGCNPSTTIVCYWDNAGRHYGKFYWK